MLGRYTSYRPVHGNGDLKQQANFLHKDSTDWGKSVQGHLHSKLAHVVSDSALLLLKKIHILVLGTSTARKNPPICDHSLYIAVTFEPIMQFKNSFRLRVY